MDYENCVAPICLWKDLGCDFYMVGHLLGIWEVCEFPKSNWSKIFYVIGYSWNGYGMSLDIIMGLYVLYIIELNFLWIL